MKWNLISNIQELSGIWSSQYLQRYLGSKVGNKVNEILRSVGMKYFMTCSVGTWKSWSSVVMIKTKSEQILIKLVNVEISEHWNDMKIEDEGKEKEE